VPIRVARAPSALSGRQAGDAVTTAAHSDVHERPGSRADRASRTRALFEQALAAPEAERQTLLESVIVLHLDLAHAEAARYRRRGIPLDDLRQVAALALTRATHRYDVTTGHEFLSFAVPTIRGELRKHFRDHGWMIRPPRRVQELQARINAAEAELSHPLGRSPNAREIAEHLGEDVESVIEALASDGCFVPTSLDHPVGGETTATLGDLLGGDDPDHTVAEARALLAPVVQRLGERDRQILTMRFYEGLTQREIAMRIGVTQMQVSRLLTRILGQMRGAVGDPGIG
jgi:RNA polymerase sigma-B factor